MSTPTESKYSVLIVEDEEILLEFLAEAAKSMGFEVLTAGNGQAASEILDANKVTVVISDINMPLLSGLQLLTRCRRQNISCPFVFITGNNRTEDLIDAVRLGAADFILKPFDLEAFTSVLNRVVEIAKRVEYIDELIRLIGQDVAPKTYIEIDKLRRQINFLQSMGNHSHPKP